MSFRLAASVRCAQRAKWSIFGMQQLMHDTLHRAAAIDNTLQDLDSSVAILQEMRRAYEESSVVAMSIWKHIRRLQDRQFDLKRERARLRHDWQFAIPAAFATAAIDLCHEDSPMSEEHRGFKMSFLMTLVLTGEISREEYALGMLGPEYIDIQGTVNDFTLRLLGTHGTIARRIVARPNQHH